ncbi:hypothetical protein SSX86_032503 [Deinandra increscens subsp. villosa]|uniref:Rubredoxin-like domain-containing protein n=1 Tax=Deinandra increscens subsp. villosa TaxID=3103831 RepID=A0AAP0C7R9_9ASTR
MASAASATFRLTQPSSSSSLSLKSKPPPHTTFPLKLPYTFHKHPKLQIAAKSTQVSKEEENRPFLDPESSSSAAAAAAAAAEPIAEFDQQQRRLEEKFAVLNTGIYECRSCGYLYNEAAGDPSYPLAPGLPFDKGVPEDWRCPTCGAAKGFFASKSVEIAGFAQNQQFGLGGNTLTSGQKAILIYDQPGASFLALGLVIYNKTDMVESAALVEALTNTFQLPARYHRGTYNSAFCVVSQL